MTKSEAISAINAEGSMNTLRRSPAWEKAFQAYNEAHGERLNNKCGSCFRKVQKWLQS